MFKDGKRVGFTENSYKIGKIIIKCAAMENRKKTHI